jgi:putative tryptophan/tyrosine transport system substrate-binding protein
MSYSASREEAWRRAAALVDKFLEGVKLMEQLTKFDLVINLKTAKDLSLTIPPSLLLRPAKPIQ